MQSAVIVSESSPQTSREETQKIIVHESINGNYVILIAIVLFCALLLFLGFPFWAILVFGTGMSFILFLLYMIRGIQIELHLNEEEVREAIEQDLFQ